MNMAVMVTGRRPSKLPWRYDENDGRCVRLKQALSLLIEGLIGCGATDFYTGMALGVDTYFAEAVLALKDERYPDIKLHAFVPCPGYESRWPKYSQDRFKAILAQADSVKYIADAYSTDCLFERNQALVDASNVTIAICGRELDGGTGHAVKQAYAKGNVVRVIDPETAKRYVVQDERNAPCMQ